MSISSMSPASPAATENTMAPATGSLQDAVQQHASSMSPAQLQNASSMQAAQGMGPASGMQGATGMQPAQTQATESSMMPAMQEDEGMFGNMFDESPMMPAMPEEEEGMFGNMFDEQEGWMSPRQNMGMMPEQTGQSYGAMQPGESPMMPAQPQESLEELQEEMAMQEEEAEEEGGMFNVGGQGMFDEPQAGGMPGQMPGAMPGMGGNSIQAELAEKEEELQEAVASGAMSPQEAAAEAQELEAEAEQAEEEEGGMFNVGGQNMFDEPQTGGMPGQMPGAMPAGGSGDPIQAELAEKEEELQEAVAQGAMSPEEAAAEAQELEAEAEQAEEAQAGGAPAAGGMGGLSEAQIEEMAEEEEIEEEMEEAQAEQAAAQQAAGGGAPAYYGGLTPHGSFGGLGGLTNQDQFNSLDPNSMLQSKTADEMNQLNIQQTQQKMSEAIKEASQLISAAGQVTDSIIQNIR